MHARHAINQERIRRLSVRPWTGLERVRAIYCGKCAGTAFVLPDVVRWRSHDCHDANESVGAQKTPLKRLHQTLDQPIRVFVLLAFGFLRETRPTEILPAAPDSHDGSHDSAFDRSNRNTETHITTSGPLQRSGLLDLVRPSTVRWRRRALSAPQTFITLITYANTKYYRRRVPALFLACVRKIGVGLRNDFHCAGVNRPRNQLCIVNVKRLRVCTIFMHSNRMRMYVNVRTRRSTNGALSFIHCPSHTRNWLIQNILNVFAD